jgi:hypothetical protein
MRIFEQQVRGIWKETLGAIAQELAAHFKKQRALS